jgi:hypothetical protein
MTRTQMGKHNKSLMVAVYGTPCAIPLHEQVTVTTNNQDYIMAAVCCFLTASHMRRIADCANQEGNIPC